MDKTVRLWHISKEECILTLPHEDVVKCISFHPKDPCYFISGSLDGKLRFWNIPDRKPVYTQPVSPRWKHGEIITAAILPKTQNGSLSELMTGDASASNPISLLFTQKLSSPRNL